VHTVRHARSIPDCRHAAGAWQRPLPAALLRLIMQVGFRSLGPSVDDGLKHISVGVRYCQYLNRQN
jgi:hypothetical protein